MTLAIVLVIAAVLALAFILNVAVSRSLQTTAGAKRDGEIQPVDLEAFRNLVNPADDEFLRAHLSPSQFRVVQRARLRAMAAYIRETGRNAAVLVRLGQAALTAHDPRTREAAERLVNEALLLRRNAAFALFRIYMALAWPNSGLAATRIVDRYERLHGSAMLLGRLQNPALPVRLSATR
jgi:hypothetical protein